MKIVPRNDVIKENRHRAPTPQANRHCEELSQKFQNYNAIMKRRSNLMNRTTINPTTKNQKIASSQ